AASVQPFHRFIQRRRPAENSTSDQQEQRPYVFPGLSTDAESKCEYFAGPDAYSSRTQRRFLAKRERSRTAGDGLRSLNGNAVFRERHSERTNQSAGAGADELVSAAKLLRQRAIQLSGCAGRQHSFRQCAGPLE